MGYAQKTIGRFVRVTNLVILLVEEEEAAPVHMLGQ